LVLMRTHVAGNRRPKWDSSPFLQCVLVSEGAAKLGALLLFILLLFDLTPGRVRVAFARGRRAPFRHLRRGHVLVVIVFFNLSLTPLTCVRPAAAGGGGTWRCDSTTTRRECTIHGLHGF